ncbi:hypothetical protein NQ317_012677 [Molorchus minor]|uniref:Ubiquitin conjugation factor E4 A n=1 Tax=Molorchus minor TaxID=1323400 RepID=A0ABQ9JCD7_9CUCU|nr:hypothetical protein NQ317_012677 [Molorchus minor]
MEAVDPPLFLRFANLLINDAIFLLDEALANMAKLRGMQQAQDNGEWANIGARERAQNVSYMHHIGNLTRFDNILARDTINTLEKLTSKITAVITHSTMVDRIAAMLNYFLLNLVGPNKKNFKVIHTTDFFITIVIKYFGHLIEHLLSDQTDPFNRSPLSMDQVIPNIELAEEIRRWIHERKSNIASQSKSTDSE